MRALLFVGLAAGLVGAAAPKADPVSLDWKLKAGDEFFVRSVQEQELTLTILGMPKEVNSTTTTVTRFRVTKAGTDGMTVEQAILRAEATGEGAEKAGKAKGATLTFVLDKEGKVTAVEGYDKYIEHITGGNEEEAKVVKLSSSEETLKISIEELFRPGPGKPVKAGDKWDRESKLPLGPLGTCVVASKYALDSVDGSAAKVSYTGDVTFSPAKGGGGLPFEITKGELKADRYEGSFTFNTAAGRVTGGTQNVGLNGTLTISAGGQEIELVMKIAIKSKTDVSDKDPGD